MKANNKEKILNHLFRKYCKVGKRGDILFFGLPWIRLSPGMREELYFNHLKNCRGIELDEGVRFFGFPWILLAHGSKLKIGPECTFASDFYTNTAGINHPCIFSTMGPNSIIIIGKGSGISGGTIVAADRVEIGEYVNIGVNCCIYDTDFHSINPVARRKNPPQDVNSSPVYIEDDVWLGANVIVLKGVRIGARSVIGAGSVVTHNVPPDSIAVGNPAKVIKKLKSQ